MPDTPPTHTTTKPPKKKRSKLKLGCLSFLGLSLILLISAGLWLRHVYTLKPTITTNYSVLANQASIDSIGSPTVLSEYAQWVHTTYLDSDEPWSEEGWFKDDALIERVQSRLAENPGTLDHLRSLTQSGPLGYIMSTDWSLDASPEEVLDKLRATNPPTVELLLPLLTYLRMDTHLLIHDTDLAIQSEDWNRAIKNVRALGQLAEYCSENQMLISDIVGLVISEHQSRTALNIASASRTHSPATLRELINQIHEARQHPIVQQIRLQTESFIMKDIVQRTYTDDGQGDGRITVEGLRNIMDITQNQPLGTAHAARFSLISNRIRLMLIRGGSRAKALELAEQWIDAGERFDRVPFWEPRPLFLSNIIDSLKPLNKSSNPDHMILGVLAPAVSKASHRRALSAATLSTAETALAIELFRIEQGNLPPTLDTLVPDYLDALPLDVYTGKPLHYRIDSPTTFTLYSAGCDLDDDDGTHSDDAFKRLRPDADGSASIAASDGDWVIWPPQSD